MMRFPDASPPYPTPSVEAAAWLDAQNPAPGQPQSIAGFRTDSPDFVRAYIASVDAWWAARAEAPLDQACDRNCWRMFGGEWISGNEMLDEPGVRSYLATHAIYAHDTMTPERFRVWAGEVYELRAMRRAIDARIVEKAHER